MAHAYQAGLLNLVWDRVPQLHEAMKASCPIYQTRVRDQTKAQLQANSRQESTSHNPSQLQTGGSSPSDSTRGQGFAAYQVESCHHLHVSLHFSNIACRSRVHRGTESEKRAVAALHFAGIGSAVNNSRCPWLEAVHEFRFPWISFPGQCSVPSSSFCQDRISAGCALASPGY